MDVCTPGILNRTCRSWNSHAIDKCERDDCDMARDMNRNAMGMVVEGFGTFCSSRKSPEIGTDVLF